MNLTDQDLRRETCYIDGAWVRADAARTLDLVDPATGEAIAQVPNAGAGETRRAIEAAERSWKPWHELTAGERGALLRRWHDLMLENQDDLARIMTAEQGKPLAESRGEIAYAASFIEWLGCRHLLRSRSAEIHHAFTRPFDRPADRSARNRAGPCR